MDVRLQWKEHPPVKSQNEGYSVCNAVAATADGCIVFAAIEDRAYVFDAKTGTVQHCLKKHKAFVNCIACSTDGKLVATGGADGMVIVWSSTFEGLVKYSHRERIQCLAFNPSTNQLASTDVTELGLWNSTSSSVTKSTVESKILSFAWSPDGRYLALGHFNGRISICDAQGREKATIDKAMPIWALSWTEMQQNASLIVVGGHDGSISSHTIDGDTLSETQLSFSPCFLLSCPKLSCLLFGGTDNKVYAVNEQCEEVSVVLEGSESISCGAYQHSREGHRVIIGTKDGTIATHKLELKCIEAKYEDWFVQRDGVDGLNIHNIGQNVVSRIACDRIVEHAAVGKDTLAVQTSHEVILYELSHPHSNTLLKSRVPLKTSSRLQAVVDGRIFATRSSTIEALGVAGRVTNRWNLRSNIRCLSSTHGQQTLLVGCEDGDVFCIHVHLPIPQLIVEHEVAIVGVEMNCDRTYIAVVDAMRALTVYEIYSQRKACQIFNEEITSVQWNERFAEMFCYRCRNGLNVKTIDSCSVNLTTQKRLISARSMHLYVIDDVGEISTVEIPLTPFIDKYIEQRRLDLAFDIACVTGSVENFKRIGMANLFEKNTAQARRCFANAKDYEAHDLIDRLDCLKSSSEEVYFAEIYCSLGRFEDAAECYASVGNMDKAIEVFSDMKLHDKGERWAAQYLDNPNTDSAVYRLLHDQAEWIEATDGAQEACAIYIKAGDYGKALDLIEKHNWHGTLAVLTNSIADTELDLLRRCAEISIKLKMSHLAEELLRRAGDTERLIELYCTTKQWPKAMDLARQKPEWKLRVQDARVHFLIKNDELIAAANLLSSFGQISEARAVLSNLIESRRFLEFFDEVCALFLRQSQLSDVIEEVHSLRRLSEMYYLYNLVQTSLNTPFSVTDVRTLFNASYLLAILLHQSCNDPPKGIRVSHVLYVLFKCAKEVGAYHVAKKACQKLCSFRLPDDWQEEVQIETLSTNTRTPIDLQELHPECFRCREKTECLSLEEDVCSHCGNKFVRCFLTLDCLPVVEFTLEEGVSIDDALMAIDQNNDLPLNDASYNWNASKAQVLQIDSESEEDEDPFAIDTVGVKRLSIPQLRRIRKRDVIVASIPHRCERIIRFYKIVDSLLPICVGESGHLFIADEYEQSCLEHGKPPFHLTTRNRTA